MAEKSSKVFERVAIVDIDRTLGDRVTLDSMDHQIDSGLIKAADELKQAIEDMERGMEVGNYINPLSNLLRVHAMTLQGVPEQELEAHEKEFFEQYESWYAYVEPLFKALLAHGYGYHLLSAGGHVTVKAIAKIFGAQGVFPSIYETDEVDVFTGKIYWDLASPGRREQAAVDAVGIYAYEGSMMFADSIADVRALSQVECPFCVNPSPALEAEAAQQEPEWPTVQLTELKNPRVPEVIMKRLGSQAWLRSMAS